MLATSQVRTEVAILMLKAFRAQEINWVRIDRLLRDFIENKKT
jgi:hypothetical protein